MFITCVPVFDIEKINSFAFIFLTELTAHHYHH
jgi:hypothetical protein